MNYSTRYLSVLAKKARLNQQSTTLYGKRSQSHTRRTSPASDQTHVSKCGSTFHSCVPLFLLNKLMSRSPVLVIVNIVVVDHVHAKLGYISNKCWNIRNVEQLNKFKQCHKVTRQE